MEDRCISKKEYLQRYDSNVGYALYVQDNIKKDDYARLNTGEIVRVIGIRENNVNKKAIYYGMHETDWFDSLAVENFSDNIIDLIECGDILEIKEGDDICYLGLAKDTITVNYTDIKESIENKECELLAILTHEQFKQNCYKV